MGAANTDTAIPCQHMTALVRGRIDGTGIVYERQTGTTWTRIPGAAFEQVLDTFGKDGWGLASMVILSQGKAAFTGLLELVFTRKRV